MRKGTKIRLLIAAAAFAAAKHRDQRRKDSEQSPYINHPIQVANILAEDGGVEDESILTAALLHDTIEDTETSSEEIEARFGADVLKLVLEVTDDKSLVKEERKRLQVENAPHKSPQAKQLKLADKICNMRDINQTSPVGWPKERKVAYLDWAEQVCQGCHGVNELLDQKFREELAQARKALEAF